MYFSQEQSRVIAEIIRLVNESQIASIKNVVIQLISLINNPDASALDLRNLLELDPPLTAQVLKRANSAFYAPPRKINDIREAIIWIGFEQVKEIALSQKIFDFFKAGASFSSQYSGQALWKHSIATALFSKYIYRREFRQTGINVYTAGLLHDIGIVIENQFLPDRFKALVNATTDSKCLYELEEEYIGFYHTQIGFKLGLNWNFPVDLVQCIGHHHTPDDQTINDKKMVSTIYVADKLAHINNMGYCDEKAIMDQQFERCLIRLSLDRSSLEMITESVIEELKKMEEMCLFV